MVLPIIEFDFGLFFPHHVLEPFIFLHNHRFLNPLSLPFFPVHFNFLQICIYHVMMLIDIRRVIILCFLFLGLHLGFKVVSPHHLFLLFFLFFEIIFCLVLLQIILHHGLVNIWSFACGFFWTLRKFNYFLYLNSL